MLKKGALIGFVCLFLVGVLGVMSCAERPSTPPPGGGTSPPSGEERSQPEPTPEPSPTPTPAPEDGLWVPDDYLTIQAAVDNAVPGDTIIVRDGTYNENIDVSTDHLTIQSENGAANCVVSASNSSDYVFYITADRVNITGFTVQNTTGAAGISLNATSYGNISGNNVTNNHIGIILRYSSNNTFTGNTASNNTLDGIFLEFSNNNTFTNNNVSDNYWGGIYLWSSSNNNLSGNTASNNTNCGIYLYSSSNNTLTSNNVSSNDFGIFLGYSNNNTIYLNNFVDNTDNVDSSYSTNTWNSPEQIAYTYQGTDYTNYTGNYWSDYGGSDPDGDGIGNSPYSISSVDNPDNYPLMEPFENYGIINRD